MKLTPKSIDDFHVGLQVNVWRLMDDLFYNDFTGYVVGFDGNKVKVQDTAGEVWECIPDQLTYSSDAIMHD